MTNTLHNTHLTDQQLRQLLQDDGAAREHLESATKHLDDCAACQHALAEMAGDDPFWEMAREHLSSGANVRPRDGVNNNAAPSSHVSAVGGDQQQSAALASSLLEPPTHPEMLGRVDQFDVESCIGQGGMGVVFRGFDRELNRMVAIKFLSPHLASNATARARFAREARAAAAVVHPNVVPIHSIRQADHPYLVMPYIPGRSLQRLVHDRGPLDELQIVRIAIHVAAGLAAAHRQGLVHRDIKPSNILQDGEDGRALLTDFGLARAADDADMTQTGWLAGTPHYMSPEQTRGENLDHRSDLFSLGSVLYFLATGRAPFRAENPMAVMRRIDCDEPLNIRSVNHEISGELEALIEWLMHKDSSRRPAMSSKFQQVCEGYLAHITNPADSPLPAELKAGRVRNRSQRRSLFWGVAVVALVAFACWAAWPDGALSRWPFAGRGAAASMPDDLEAVPVPAKNAIAVESPPAIENPTTTDIRELLNSWEDDLQDLDEIERDLAEFEDGFRTQENQ